MTMLGSVSMKGKSKAAATQRPDLFFFPSRRRPQQKSSNLLLGVKECEFWLGHLHRLVGHAESTGSEGFLEKKAKTPLSISSQPFLPQPLLFVFFFVQVFFFDSGPSLAKVLDKKKQKQKQKQKKKPKKKQAWK